MLQAKRGEQLEGNIGSARFIINQLSCFIEGDYLLLTLAKNCVLEWSLRVHVGVLTEFIGQVKK